VIDTGQLAAFFIASIAIIVAPGPSVLFTLARGVAWGRAVAVLTVAGNSLGTLVLSVVVALGLGPLLASSKAFSVALQIAGGAYLVWLGVDAFRHREAHAQAMVAREGERPSPVMVVRQGFVVGVLNPKSLVFFAAVFPHFVDRAKGHETVQLLIFGIIFSVMAFCSDGTWGFIAGTAGACVMMTLGTLIVVTALTS
jgi:threonine/homoserine/homoserine lactone efflux protein